MPLAALSVGAGTAIAGALGAGAAVAGARSSQRAQRDASRMEMDATNRALQDAREQRAYEQKRDEDERAYRRSLDEQEFGRYTEKRDYDRGQYANYLGRLQPYSATGSTAVANLGASVTRALPAAVPAAGGSAMVKIQAPEEYGGGISEVPAAHVQHYLSKGGKVVG